MMFAGSCRKYDDTPLQNRVGNLENCVAKLEELCQRMNVSELIENLARHHLETYGDDIERWRKL